MMSDFGLLLLQNAEVRLLNEESYVKLITIGFLGLYAWNQLYIYRDAVRRGMNPYMTVMMTTFFIWPLSNAWWFWLRPSIDKKTNKQIVIRKNECIACHYEMPPNAEKCPNCGWVYKKRSSIGLTKISDSS